MGSGKDWESDVRVGLFVRLADGVTLDEALVAKIKQRIRTGATPRHVPAKVLAVSDIPRTKSGKIVELAVRNVVHGRPVKNVEALANPEALAESRARAQLAEFPAATPGRLATAPPAPRRRFGRAGANRP